MSERLRYDATATVATITLDDGKANVLSPAMQTEIAAALDEAAGAGLVVVLAGRDGRFSGGFDLSVMGSDPAAAAEMVMSGMDLALKMLTLPRPIVAACTGHAIAMGAFLLAASDHRVGITGGGHRIVANEVQIGMTLPRAAIEICRGVLTPAAFRIGLDLATPFTHDEAVAAGWLDEVVPADGLLDRAHEVAERLAGLDARAHVGTKTRTRADLVARLTQAIAEDRAELAAALA